MKAVAFILEGKFCGKSALEYLIDESKFAIDILYQFFLARKPGKSVWCPGEWTKETKFAFVISSIDDYFYENSTARKKARLCRKVESDNHLEVAQTAKSGLPSFNFTGKLITDAAYFVVK